MRAGSSAPVLFTWMVQIISPLSALWASPPPFRHALSLSFSTLPFSVFSPVYPKLCSRRSCFSSAYPISAPHIASAPVSFFFFFHLCLWGCNRSWPLELNVC